MNDDFLNKFRKPPRPEFAAALYQRISTPMHAQSKYPIRRLTGLSLSILAVLTVTLLLSPSARAFAGGIIRQVGVYVFTQGTIDATNKIPSDIAIVRTHDNVSIQMKKDLPAASDAAGAGKLAGFTVLAPAYLPAGYTPMTGWMVTSDLSGVTATRGYKDGTNNFLIINELKKASGTPETAFHRDEIVDVTIRGHAGVWLPDPSSPNGKNALVWDENGITYSLLSNSLSLNEMLKVAESLH